MTSGLQGLVHSYFNVLSYLDLRLVFMLYARARVFAVSYTHLDVYKRQDKNIF